MLLSRHHLTRVERFVNEMASRRMMRPYDSNVALMVQGERWEYISSVRTREYTRSTSHPNECEHLDSNEARKLTTLNESTTMVSICGHLSLSATSLTPWTTKGLRLSSLIRSTTPVVSNNVSTNKMVRFEKGDIFDKVLSIEF